VPFQPEIGSLFNLGKNSIDRFSATLNPALHIDRKGRAAFNFNKLLVHDAETALGTIEFPSGK